MYNMRRESEGGGDHDAGEELMLLARGKLGGAGSKCGSSAVECNTGDSGCTLNERTKGGKKMKYNGEVLVCVRVAQGVIGGSCEERRGGVGV
eukprot:1231608-Pleurochrysis_carterae.AAC.1